MGADLGGELRIKVLDDPEGGRLVLSAPAAAFTPGEWAAWSDQLLAAIEGRLAASNPPAGARPAGSTARASGVEDGIWSGREDSNLRPHGPEPCALPG